MYVHEKDYMEIHESLYFKSKMVRSYFEKFWGVFLICCVYYTKKTLIFYQEFCEKLKETSNESICKMDHIIRLICNGLDEFATPHDKKLLICSMASITHFYACEYKNTEQEEYLTISQFCVEKLIILIKVFYMQKKCSQVDALKNPDTIKRAQYIELYNVLRKEMDLLPMTFFVQYSQIQNPDLLEEPELFNNHKNENMKVRKRHKKIMMDGVHSKFININELNFCRKLMEQLKEQGDLFAQIVGNLGVVAKSYGPRVLFQYHYLVGNTNKMPRKIAKLKKKQK
jgi:hypothetical protein